MIDAEDQDHGRALSTFPNTNKLIDDLCVLQQANVSSRPTFPPGLPIPEAAPESGMEAPCWVQQLRQPAKSQENENTIVPKATPLLPAMKSWMRSNGIEESDMIQNEGQENAVENTEEDEIEQMALGSTLLVSHDWLQTAQSTDSRVAEYPRKSFRDWSPLFTNEEHAPTVRKGKQ